MKNIRIGLLLLAVLLVLCLTIVACTDKPDTDGTETTIDTTAEGGETTEETTEEETTEEVTTEPETVVQTIFDGFYHANVDFINDCGPNGSSNYAGLGASSGSRRVPQVSATRDGKTVQDYVISIGGWMAVDGGIHAYGYTVNNGPLIIEGSAGRDGEPLEGHYAGLGATKEGSLKNGIFHGQESIQADLYDYAGMTVTITFYAVPEIAQDTVAPIVCITNLAVPAREDGEVSLTAETVRKRSK